MPYIVTVQPIKTHPRDLPEYKGLDDFWQPFAMTIRSDGTVYIGWKMWEDDEQAEAPPRPKPREGDAFTIPDE